MNFKDKINNLLNNNKSVSLRFLSLEEQTYFSKLSDVKLYGGYKNAEKKRAYFFDNKEDNIILYKIIHNDKYLTLTHQNILGTLVSLGITIDSIGDILPKQGVFFATREISKEIKNSFTKISNVSIELIEYDKDLVHSENEFLESSVTLDSLRLDLVISKITNKSRNNSLEMIQKELVKVNHKAITKHTTFVNEDDVISIRKFGRFIILDTKKRSKKGKIVLKYAKYI